MTQEEGFPASGWMTAGTSMCRRRNQAVKTGGSGKSAERKNQGFIVAQLLSHKSSKTYLSKFVKENGYERVAHGIYAAPDIWPDELYLSGMKKILDKKRAVDHFKDGQAYVSDLYSQKKETTFAAYLCLGTEDGKASFRLEFPKKKEKKHLPVNDTGREELNERKTCL